jgi:hypothetical protein
MTGADLRGAKFDEARLDGAELSYAQVQGANFSNARLDKADLSGGIQAQGANFLVANLQGADLTGAQLMGADFSSADMTAAVLSYARLDLATLRDARLEGAALYRASLLGADMIGASIVGADLREAKVWKTVPPQPDSDGLADLTDIRVSQITDADALELKSALDRVLSRRVKARLTEALAPLINLPEAGNWASSSDYTLWQGLAQAGQQTTPDIYKPRLTDYLMRLECRPRWSNGAVATGVARRAGRPEFRGDLIAIYDRLRADDCPASKTVVPKALKDLATAADIARGG